MRKIGFLFLVIGLVACSSASKRDPSALTLGLTGDSPQEIVRMMKTWLKPGTHAGFTSQHSPCVVHVLSSVPDRYDIFVSETNDPKDNAGSLSVTVDQAVLYHVFAMGSPQALHIDRYPAAMSFHDSVDMRRDTEGAIAVKTQHLQEDLIQDSIVCTLAK
jgi:hypothetical protein